MKRGKGEKVFRDSESEASDHLSPFRLFPFSPYFRKVSPLFAPKRMAWAIIAFGLILRAVQYLYNRSLWADEATLALNIIDRSFSGLLLPLSDDQAAPIGFLVVERAAVLLFGASELSLRLFPFLCGVGALFLFYEVARRCLTPTAVVIALALFACADNPIYFSSEVKQYSSDIAASLLILLMAIDLYSKQVTARRIALFGLAGAVVVWVSHPAIFVLAGAGTALFFLAAARKDWKKAVGLATAGALWIASFAATYFISLKNLGGNQELHRNWNRRGTFMPLPPRTLSDIEWFFTALLNMFSNPLDVAMPYLAAAVFLIGCVSVALKKNARLVIIISPIFFALLASGLHTYPFGRRLLLFLVPSILLFIAEGSDRIIEFKRPYSILLGAAVIALLLFEPFLFSAYSIIKPRAREEFRPVMSHVINNRQPGDLVYVYYDAEKAFEYYNRRFGLAGSDYVIGANGRYEWNEDNNPAYAGDLEKLRGRGRVWLVFTHVRQPAGVNEEVYFITRLDLMGTRLDGFKAQGASAYLYDLGNKDLNARER